VRALTWNLFHGRDVPVDVDYRHSLHGEFAALLARFEWDVALLQEAPPRWFRELAFRSGAQGRLVKTSRNQLGVVRGWVGERFPDLIKSGEGGSNQILFRRPWIVAEQRNLTLARWPERRRMMWVRLHHPSGATVCIANLHASAHNPARSAQELECAADAALEWSGHEPLLLGGDFNTRPKEQPWIFERLAQRGFSEPTAPHAIDHLLARGMRVAEPARQLPAERREVPVPDAGRVRLSDHAVVVATFDVE
jgi:endonuclease/exonuclease/phosphatase family metal-dependent hydrolase